MKTSQDSQLTPLTADLPSVKRALEEDKTLRRILDLNNQPLAPAAYAAYLRGSHEPSGILTLVCNEAFQAFVQDKGISYRALSDTEASHWWQQFLPEWEEREKREQLRTRYTEAFEYLSKNPAYWHKVWVGGEKL